MSTSKSQVFPDNQLIDGGEVVNLIHQLLFNPLILILICAKGWVDARIITWLEGLDLLKIQVTLEIEPTTFRNVGNS
jgi:hypothetical protein